MCKLKQNEYWSKFATKLDKVIISGKSWWNLAKEMNGATLHTLSSQSVSISEFFVFFKHLLNQDSIHMHIYFVEPLIENENLDKLFTDTELNDAIHNLKAKKAPGTDRISSEFYKNAPENFKNLLLNLYNTMFEKCSIPNSFKQSIILPIKKKGGQPGVANFRGISFINAKCKILTSMLRHRFNNWLEENEILGEEQAGFRKGRSTFDHIFTLFNVIEIRKSKTYALFVDFKAAYDSVPRQLLFYKLSTAGVSSKFISMLRELYNNASAVIWNGSELSDVLPLNVGLKQGCEMSPDLFAFYINDLKSRVGGGVKIGNFYVNLLAYADDVVLLAEQPDQLQSMINKLSIYCKEWGLTINTQKTQVMIFNKTGKRGRSEKWFFDGKQLEVVSNYKYLGVTISSQLSMNQHLLEQQHKAKINMNVSWGKFIKNNNVTLENKYKIFQAVSQSTLCYAAQVWGWKRFDEVEAVQRFFIKRILNLPSTTPNYMIFLELGIQPLFYYTWKLNIDYVMRVLKMDRNRLPYKTAMMAIKKENIWFKEWQSCARMNEMNINGIRDDEIDVEALRNSLYNIINADQARNWEEIVQRARSGSGHGVYPKLSYHPKIYSNKKVSSDMVITIFKARGSLFCLNGMRRNPSANKKCSLCNLNEIEDFLHFFGKCPVLKITRSYFLKYEELNEGQVIEILDSGNLRDVYGFVKAALSIRGEMCKEFNY